MKIFIASPIYRGVEAPSAFSFACLFVKLNSILVNPNNPWSIVDGDSNQARARNLLFKLFLDSGADKMVSIDPDQVFSPEDVIKLIEVDEDVVVPLINKRIPDGGLVGLPKSGTEVEANDQIIEMERIGFGLVVFTRSCIEKIASTRPVFNHHGLFVPEIVSQYLDGNNWVAIDDCFSQRWLKLGGTLHLHTGVSIGHLGKFVY